MIKLYLKDAGVNFNDKTLRSKLNSLKNIEVPTFASYKPDFDSIAKIAKKLKKYRRMIVIGRGGSITGFKSMYTALGISVDKDVYLLDTLDPDLLDIVKENTSKNDTIVIAVSKSGNTVDVIESILFFKGYDVLAITQDNDGALKQIVDSGNLLWLEHPDVGGRYSSGTECALAPAAIAGLDYMKIFAGMKRMFRKCDPSVGFKNNPALQLASFFYLADRKGYSSIFLPVYSPFLGGSIELMMQLIHESSGKDGKGQIIFGAEAPESQHHTNQRLFGGTKNMCACFVRVSRFNDNKIKVKVPNDLSDVKLKDSTLKILDGLEYGKAMQFEFIGTQENAVKLKIPNVVITLDKLTPDSLGEFIALFEYATVYYCNMLGVDPFNQPHVEGSKRISYTLRKNHKKIGRDKYL